MAKYDLEDLMADVKSIMTTYLNTKITALNSEKSDAITLVQVDSEAYHLQQMNGKSPNFDPFIIYGVTNIEGEGLGPHTETEIDVQVALVLADNGEDVEITNRMYRYGRALREVFEEHFSENSNAIKLSIKSLVPVQFTGLNSANDSRVVGVTLSLAFA